MQPFLTVGMDSWRKNKRSDLPDKERSDLKTHTNAVKGIHTNLRTPLLYPQKRALSTPLLRKLLLSGNEQK